MKTMNILFLSTIGLLSLSTLAMDPPQIPQDEKKPEEQQASGSSWYDFGVELGANVYDMLGTASKIAGQQYAEKSRWVNSRFDSSTQLMMVGLIYDEMEYNKTVGIYKEIQENFNTCCPDKFIQPYSKRIAIATKVAGEILARKEADAETLANIKRFNELNGPVLPAFITNLLNDHYIKLYNGFCANREKEANALAVAK